MILSERVVIRLADNYPDAGMSLERRALRLVQLSVAEFARTIHNYLTLQGAPA